MTVDMMNETGNSSVEVEVRFQMQGNTCWENFILSPNISFMSKSITFILHLNLIGICLKELITYDPLFEFWVPGVLLSGWCNLINPYSVYVWIVASRVQWKMYWRKFLSCRNMKCIRSWVCRAGWKPFVCGDPFKVKPNKSWKKTRCNFCLSAVFHTNRSSMFNGPLFPNLLGTIWNPKAETYGS